MVQNIYSFFFKINDNSAKKRLTFFLPFVFTHRATTHLNFITGSRFLLKMHGVFIKSVWQSKNGRHDQACNELSFIFYAVARHFETWTLYPTLRLEWNVWYFAGEICFIVCFKFKWRLLLRVPLSLSQHWFNKGMYGRRGVPRHYLRR